MIVNWGAEALDSGRIVVVRVGVKPEDVQSEVKLVLGQFAKTPVKGFRTGKIAGSALRRIYGRKALDMVRDGLLEKSYGAAIEGAAKRFGFDPAKAPAPVAVNFSEEEGLSYEVLVTGLEPTSQSVESAGSVVDFRQKKES